MGKGNFLSGEWIGEGILAEWVVVDARRWRCTDFAKASWDKESNGGPVSITGLDSFLILSHGVHLNIRGVVVEMAGAFPGNNILDVVRFEAAKYDDVTAKKGLVVPSGGVDVDAIMYTTENAFRVNVANG